MSVVTRQRLTGLSSGTAALGENCTETRAGVLGLARDARRGSWLTSPAWPWRSGGACATRVLRCLTELVHKQLAASNLAAFQRGRCAGLLHPVLSPV